MAKTRSRNSNSQKSAAGRRTPLQTLGTEELERELARRQRQIRTLERKRVRLAEQLQNVESELNELGALGGVIVSGIRKRPKNEANLADSLAKVLKSRTMSVTKVADAVRQAGYRTSAENFRTIVNQTLINDTRFKRVERGRYTAK